MQSELAEIEPHGFRIQRAALSPEQVLDLVRVVEQHADGQVNPGRGGTRNLLALPAVRQLAGSSNLRGLVEPVLGADAFAVRGILFDKTPGANWSLRWHQDRAIPVQERHEVPGFGPWSVKAGVPHVFPPAEVLEEMLTVRIHLDSCDALHGALEVLPGSHRHGLLSKEELARRVQAGSPVVCEASRGDALIMRPLLAHASGRCERPGHRRVLHLEYAHQALPAPLEWQERIS